MRRCCRGRRCCGSIRSRPTSSSRWRSAAKRRWGDKLPLDEDARTALYELADGDGRALLGLVEEVFAAAKPDEMLDKAALLQVVQRRAPIYDKKQDGHYNLISALHKTVRGSDPNAALYYLARMLVAGEDPLFLARRMIRMASEDIGMADPQALPLAIAARDAYEMLGSPEGELALAELCVYLATAPKSNSVEVAFNEAMALARSSGSPMPPMTILNAPTKLMKGQGYGSGYIYDHDTPEGFSGQEYFPEKLGRQNSIGRWSGGSSARSSSGSIIGTSCATKKARRRIGRRGSRDALLGRSVILDRSRSGRCGWRHRDHPAGSQIGVVHAAPELVGAAKFTTRRIVGIAARNPARLGRVDLAPLAGLAANGDGVCRP